MRAMVRLRGAAAICALALAGCAAQPIGTFDDARITSEAAQAQTDLYFRPGEVSLLPGEVERVNRLLASLVLGPQDDVVMTFGTSGSDVLDTRRIAEARRVIASAPARLRIVAPPGFARAPDQPDIVLIQAIRYSRVLVTCPGSGRTNENPAYLAAIPPMGCANAVNLAAQAAAPRDLTAPRRLEGSETVRAIAAVERYREGPIVVPSVGASEN